MFINFLNSYLMDPSFRGTLKRGILKNVRSQSLSGTSNSGINQKEEEKRKLGKATFLINK